ncbi:Organic cation/carnitine transporter 4 [Ancistrocladus abbreviatus]
MPTTKTPLQHPAGDNNCRLQDLETPLIPTGNDKSSSPEKLCIDEMLQKYSGEFGLWQLRHFVLTSLAWALEALHTMVMIFADREPTWRCIDAQGCPSERGMCDLEPGSWEWILGPGGSTVSEWGLVCGEKYKVGLVQALFFGGCLIGAYVLSLGFFLCPNIGHILLNL